MKKTKLRLDKLLLELGYFEDSKVAQAWIMAGKVVVNSAVISKPGTLVNMSAEIHLRDRPLRFASRGGYKLERALNRFNIDVRNLVCLDGGASAGGFTDCLLQRGARLVYAVDVGFGQLRGKLSSDRRVVSLERTNISDIKIGDLDPPIDFACADFSYLSLTKAVPIVGQLFRRPKSMIFLVKPLYEGLLQSDIADHSALSNVIDALLARLANDGFPANDACASPILGGRGAIEFLVCFKDAVAPAPRIVAERAMADLRANPPVDIATLLDVESGGPSAVPSAALR